MGAFGPIFAAAIFVEITIAVVGSALGALDSRGPDVSAGFGSPGAIGELLLTKFLAALRGGLVPAAGGGGRRGGAGAQAARAGEQPERVGGRGRSGEAG